MSSSSRLMIHAALLRLRILYLDFIQKKSPEIYISNGVSLNIQTIKVKDKHGIEILSLTGDFQNEINTTNTSVKYHLNGTSFSDLLYGTNDDDIIKGLAGNDVLFGGEGQDILYNSEGEDVLFGGPGDDTFYIDAFPDSSSSIRDLATGDIVIVSEGELFPLMTVIIITFRILWLQRRQLLTVN